MQADQNAEGTRAADRVYKLVHTKCSEMGDNEVNKCEQKQDNTSPNAANKKGKRTFIKPPIQEAGKGGDAPLVKMQIYLNENHNKTKKEILKC